MKSITAIVLLIISSMAQADVLGAKAGYSYWRTDSYGDFQTVYGQFEHFVPLLPNAAVRYGTVDDKRLSFNSYDAYGYYEVLDNGLLEVDFGLGLRRFNNGKSKGQSFSDTVPTLNAEAVVLGIGSLNGYARIDLGRSRDTTFQDLEAGLRYQLFGGLTAQAGYRIYKLNLDIDNGETLRGFTAGLNLDI